MMGCDSKWSVMLTKFYIPLFSNYRRLMTFLANKFMIFIVDILVLSCSKESIPNY